MHIERRHFIASLGGAAAVGLMSHEAKAEALEHYMSERLEAVQQNQFPSAAEVEDQIVSRHYRRGVGGLFVTRREGQKVTQLDPLPARATFLISSSTGWRRKSTAFRAPI